MGVSNAIHWEIFTCIVNIVKYWPARKAPIYAIDWETLSFIGDTEVNEALWGTVQGGGSESESLEPMDV